jgi:predicted Zn-dependent peptidase
MSIPSNNLELALWMESTTASYHQSNRVDTQNGVIKEEKNSRYDNQPYGKILPIVKENMFESHPYRWSTIGSMEHLDTATLEDFKDFHKKFYIPNNAVLVVPEILKTK